MNMGKRQFFMLSSAAVMLLLAKTQLSGAIGCTLNNPARDLKTLFPEMTSYVESVQELQRMPEGAELYEMLKKRVGGDLDPVYEQFETPYTLYSVFKEKELLAYVHGVNVPGRGGVIQIFLSLDPSTAAIRHMFFQRLESPGGRLLRSTETREQFAGLTLADFYKHDYFAAVEQKTAGDKVGNIMPPEKLPVVSLFDWHATMRGVRKNLILLDIFVFDRRHEPFYERAQKMLREEEKEDNDE